uniref:Uncharacterized protein n=1 Tax=Rhipicephalus zambeziensis TaxID=60191 RepID=A0A224Y6M6_9ACAR
MLPFGSRGSCEYVSQILLHCTLQGIYNYIRKTAGNCFRFSRQIISSMGLITPEEGRAQPLAYSSSLVLHSYRGCHGVLPRASVALCSVLEFHSSDTSF